MGVHSGPNKASGRKYLNGAIDGTKARPRAAGVTGLSADDLLGALFAPIPHAAATGYSDSPRRSQTTPTSASSPSLLLL
jgi:hypothetical protein